MSENLGSRQERSLTEEKARGLLVPKKVPTGKEKQFFGKALCKRLVAHLTNPDAIELDVLRATGGASDDEIEFLGNEDPRIFDHMRETGKIADDFIHRVYAPLFKRFFPVPSQDTIARFRIFGIGSAPPEAARLVKEIYKFYNFIDKLEPQYSGTSYYNSTLVGLQSYVFQGFCGLFIEDALDRVPEGMTEIEFARLLASCLSSQKGLSAISRQLYHYLEDRNFLNGAFVQRGLEALPEAPEDFSALNSDLDSLLVSRLIERFSFSMGDVQVSVMLDDFNLPNQAFDGSKQRTSTYFLVELQYEGVLVRLRYDRLYQKLGFLGSFGKPLEEVIDPRLCRNLQAFLIEKVMDYLLGKDEDRFPDLFKATSAPVLVQEASEVRQDVMDAILETPVVGEEEVAPTWKYTPYQAPCEQAIEGQDSLDHDTEALREERRKRARLLRDQVSALDCREVNAAFAKLYGKAKKKRGKGSHRVYIHPTSGARVTAPYHSGSDSGYGVGMLLSQLQDMGTTLEEFVNAL